MLGPQCPDIVNYPWVMVFGHCGSESCSSVVERFLSACRLRCSAPMRFLTKANSCVFFTILYITQSVSFITAELMMQVQTFMSCSIWR